MKPRLLPIVFVPLLIGGLILGSLTGLAAVNVTVTNTFYNIPPNRFHRTESFYGVIEGGLRFQPAELADLGVNALRIYAGMARTEPNDDDGVYGMPTPAQVKADPGIIPWTLWDSTFANDNTYWWCNGIAVSFQDIIDGCVANGVEPVLCMRGKDSRDYPAWYPSSPATQEDFNEWWEYCFAMAYWLNVRNNYQIKYWEYLNEPNGRDFGGGMDDYALMIDYMYDAVKTVAQIAGLPAYMMGPNNGDHDEQWIDGILQRRDDKIDIVDYHEYANDQDAYARGYWARVWNNDTDGIEEPIWNGEWGNALGGYETISDAMDIVTGLYEQTISDMYGNTLYCMWPWGTQKSPGLVLQDGTKTETYYAMRCFLRGNQGGKNMYLVQNNDASLLYLGTRDAANLYLTVINNGSAKTLSVDVSAHAASGTAYVYEYSAANKDVLVATIPFSAAFTVSSPATSVVCVKVPLSGGGDTESPTAPTNLTATAVSSSQIDLTWTASTDNVGVTGYKVFRGGVEIDTTANTSYQDTGLQPGTAYSYYVKAYDAAGNISPQSNTAQATTQPGGGDTEPPTAPTNLTATAVSSSQINLSWTASTDNVGVTGYQVFRDGEQVGTSGTTSYSDTGLSPGTTYSYYVKAYDAAGNVSGASNTAQATTQSGGGTNLALGKTTSVSSYEYTQVMGDKAVDGDISTYWRSKKKSALPAEWITVDLAASYTIDSVTLKWGDYWATSYRIDVSPDNNNWTTVHNTTSGDGGTDSITFTAVSARYVRMYSTAWNQSSERLRLNEFEIYQ